MRFWDAPPVRDFPDRAIRRLLEDPANLEDLLSAVVPELAARLDFSQVEFVGREFLLEDWHRREADLLFRLPYRAGEEEQPVLVCLLIEHQSEPDPRMPLRTLLYAVLYWEQEWRHWEAGPAPKEPLRLTPVVPIIFHTGPGRWTAPRDLAPLVRGPEALKAWTPRWEPLFWALSERTPEELLGSARAWLQALAVVRGERSGPREYRELVAEVARQLGSLSETERQRWHDLLAFVLSWVLRRRAGAEHAELIAGVQQSQIGREWQREVAEMSETLVQTWEEELLAQGVAQGVVQGALQTRREDLRLLLEERFGELSPAFAARIEACQDPERLRQALRRVVRVQSPEELEL